METQNIKLDDLIMGENQARSLHPGGEIEELAQSIKNRGLLQPIRVVRAKSPNEGKYEIIMGQRRFLAFRHLGLTEIPAVIAQSKDDPIEYLIDSVTENTQRKDTTYEENKAVCVKLWRRFGSVKAIIDMTGLSEHFVRKHIKWTELNPKLRQMVDDGIVNLDAATKATEVARLEEDNPSEETINQMAIDLNKLTQSQRVEVKKKKKANTAVKTVEIIKKVESEG
jgi:ParB family transcriptional regulator, chromosome partitioning protein